MSEGSGTVLWNFRVENSVLVAIICEARLHCAAPGVRSIVSSV